MKTIWIGLFGLAVLGCGDNGSNPGDAGCPLAATTGDPAATDADGVQAALDDGRKTFRFDTFGDEAWWGDTLHLHQAIAGAANGGVGPGVSPKTALAVGLKVDADMLPASLVAMIQAGKVDLDDPATTLALLQLGAVVGVAGTFDAGGKISSIGITCALCHSTVDDSFSAGIGKRRDGWPNRDLDVGKIILLAPDLSAIESELGADEATVRQVLGAWGPGKFDAELVLDGKGFRPDGKTAATLIPPAFGRAGNNLITWTGWGSVTYWNAFVAVLEMHGKGTFFDARLDERTDGGTPRFPLAVKNGFSNVRNQPDLVTPKLANLHLYQLSLPAPTPPAGSFDPAAAARGQMVFNGPGKCATCHVPPLFTEPGWNMHAGAEIGIDDFQAQRSPDQRYRTAPLNGLFAHAKGGFFHDGRFPTLNDVVEHYDAVLGLSLSAGQKADLVEYLKSI
jgi:hypothetical protein